MNERQFSDRIGNMDDRFVQQAEQLRNYSREHRNKRIRHLITLAAVIALMACSFGLGALAFPKEVVIEVPVEVPVEIPVEVPVEEETIEIKEIGLTLILPDSWKGKYAFEKADDYKEYHVYHPDIREAAGGDSETPLSGGMLFYIKLWDEQLTKEQVDAGGEWDYARCRYIMTTKDGTYLLYYASDVQFTQETLEEYRRMESEISDIRFVADKALD